MKTISTADTRWQHLWTAAIFIAWALFVSNAHAQFRYNNDNEFITIQSYLGTSNSIAVPAEIHGFTVTTIGERAFYNTLVKSVFLPKSITTIHPMAFDGTTNLAAIYVDETNENYADQDGILFDKGHSDLIVYPRGRKDLSYAVPVGVGVIRDWAFAHSQLVNLTFPESLVSIGSRSFCECPLLTGIKIPQSVTSIGDMAFAACPRLKNINIPDGVINLGVRAFFDCTGLTEATIMGGQIKLPEELFAGCARLKQIRLPDTLANIADKMFLGCSNLESVMMPPGIAAIGQYAFAGTGLTNLALPDGVIQIGPSAFSDCTSLEAVS